MIAITQNSKRLPSLIFNVFKGIFFLLQRGALHNRNFVYPQVLKMFRESQIFADAA